MQALEPVYIPKSVTGSVKFGRVSFGFIQEKPILQNFSLELPAGKITVLIGTTGAGTSTLAGMLVRFYDPQAGTIFLGGVDLRKISAGNAAKYCRHHNAGCLLQEV